MSALLAGVAMHGLYSGSQSDATAALQKSGLLSISGITTNTLTEQAFIESVLDFGQETIGGTSLHSAVMMSIRQVWPHV